MVALKLDHTINTPTLISIIASLISVVVFVMNIKTEVKVRGAQVDQLIQEVGEVRKLHLKTASIAVEQAAIIDTNTKKIKANTAALKSVGIPVSAVVAVPIKPVVPQTANSDNKQNK